MLTKIQGCYGHAFKAHPSLLRLTVKMEREEKNVLVIHVPGLKLLFCSDFL